MKELIRMSHISNKKDVVDFNICIRYGEAMALLGDNKSGKDSIKDILIGKNNNYTGSIYINEEPVAIENEVTSRRKGILYINIENFLVKTLTIYENIYIIRKKRHSFLLPKRLIVEQTSKLLDYVGLKVNPNKFVYELSYFEKLLVCIAKAITTGNKLIVLESPSNALDYMEVSRLNQLINKLKAEETSFLIFIDKPSEIFQSIDNITIMNNGIDKIELKNEDYNENMIFSIMHGFEPIDDNSWGGINNSIYLLNDKTNFSEEFTGITGIFDTTWNNSQSALIYFRSFLEQNDFIIKKAKYIFNMNVATIEELYEQKVIYLPESCHNLLFNNTSIKENLIITRSFIEHCQLINNRIENYSYIEFLKRINSSKDIQSIEQLSIIQKKILAIYRWERINPRLIILDSPTKNLDEMDTNLLIDYLKHLAKRGVSIIVICRHLSSLQLLCNNIIYTSNKRFISRYDSSDYDNIEKDIINNKRIKKATF